MDDFSTAFSLAFNMIARLDPDLVEIVLLSLRVSLSALGIAALIALPLGAAVALFRFPGSGVVTVLLNAMMGLPPVVVGLVVYLLISRSGPLGVLGLLVEQWLIAQGTRGAGLEPTLSQARSGRSRW